MSTSSRMARLPVLRMRAWRGWPIPGRRGPRQRRLIRYPPSRGGNRVQRTGAWDEPKQAARGSAQASVGRVRSERGRRHLRPRHAKGDRPVAERGGVISSRPDISYDRPAGGTERGHAIGICRPQGRCGGAPEGPRRANQQTQRTYRASAYCSQTRGDRIRERARPGFGGLQRRAGLREPGRDIRIAAPTAYAISTDWSAEFGSDRDARCDNACAASEPELVHAGVRRGGTVASVAPTRPATMSRYSVSTASRVSVPPSRYQTGKTVQERDDRARCDAGILLAERA